MSEPSNYTTSEVTVSQNKVTNFPSDILTHVLDRKLQFSSSGNKPQCITDDEGCALRETLNVYNYTTVSSGPRTCLDEQCSKCAYI